MLANFGVTSPRAFDAAIQRWFGADDYRVQLTQSVDLGTPPISAHDATMPGSAILHLYEVQLSAEPIEIRLENQSGTVNWGLTVHAPTAAFGGKTSGLGVVVDANGDGGGELATFTAPVAGRYAIAVWKAGSSDNGKAGQYRLKVLRTATDVADAAVAPRTSAITGVVPNPFNPRTTIAFDVAASGMVSLQLFDLLGKHVRTLEEKSFAAGHHEVAWDGLDDTGHKVASGVYFVRMSGTGASSQRKMVLLK